MISHVVAARRMARRRMKKKTPTRRKQPINALKLAESAVIASAATQGMFNVNLIEFLTGRVNGQFRPGGDGSNTITLPELLGFSANGFNAANIGGRYATGKTFTGQVQYNLSRQGTKMAATLIMAPIAFRVFGKLTASPRRSANKLLKMAGLKSVVKV